MTLLTATVQLIVTANKCNITIGKYNIVIVVNAKNCQLVEIYLKEVH